MTKAREKVVNINDTRVKMTDSLVNLLTGLGVEGFSKSPSAHFTDIALSYDELESAYSSDWLSGKVCDVIPFDMTREWRRYDSSMEEDYIEDMYNQEKKLKVREKCNEALTWARVYGGSGIVMNVKDGQSPDKPLKLDSIQKDSLQWLNVADSRYLRPYRFDYDPFSPNYGYPELYTLAPSSVRIHHSRILRFDGYPLPLSARRRNNYWGKSAIERLYTALKNATAAQDNVGELIYEATVDVVKVPDLQSMVSDQESEEALKKRWGLAKLQKAINRFLLLDGNEEYESHQQSFQGLKDMMQQFLNVAAGAADIPITRLLGQSPGGLNSTGDSDLHNYYDSIHGQQEYKLRPQLEYFDIVLYKSLTGKLPEPGELDFIFNPLWQMSDLDRSTVELNRAQRDQIYIDKNVINEVIIAKQLAADGTYTGIDSEYIELLESMDDGGEEEDDEFEAEAQTGEEEDETGSTKSSESE